MLYVYIPFFSSFVLPSAWSSSVCELCFKERKVFMLRQASICLSCNNLSRSIACHYQTPAITLTHSLLSHHKKNGRGGGFELMNDFRICETSTEKEKKVKGYDQQENKGKCPPGGGVVTSVETAERQLTRGENKSGGTNVGACTKCCYYIMLVHLKLHSCLCVEDTGTFSVQTCLHSRYFQFCSARVFDFRNR